MPIVTGFNNLFLIPAAVLFVFLSGLFSGAETGAYQLSLLRLRLGVEKKRLSFKLLTKVLHDRTALLISILIGTNLSQYLATSIVTYILLSSIQAEHMVVLITTVIITPVLFVFSELLPKNIFFYRSDYLMPHIAVVLFFFKKLFTYCGIIPFLKAIAALFAKLTGSALPAQTAATVIRSSYIKTLFKETREEDVLSSVQSDIINRLADISHVTIRTVMISLNNLEMVDVDSDRTALTAKLKRCVFTRLPVYERYRSNVIGFINIYDCLSSAGAFTGLSGFIKPLGTLDSNTLVTKAINIMRSKSDKMILVTRSGYAGRQKPVGIITMNDLVDELLGEPAE